MKRTFRPLLVLALAIALLTTTAFADMGPKSQLVVRVENAPDEPYYLDILAEGNRARYETLSDKELAELDSALLDSLISAIPAGWHGCVSQGTDGPPIFGKLTAREDGTHHFSYHGVPWTYRILMVSASGEVFLSDVQERTALQSSATVDWAGKNLTTPPTWLAYAVQFLSTFLPTLLMEGLLLLAFGLWNRKNLKVFFAVNLLTQGALALYFSIHAVRNGVAFGYQFLLVAAELAILAVEFAIYRRTLTGNSDRIGWYAVTANVCSAIIDFIISEPVWRFVVSIS